MSRPRTYWTVGTRDFRTLIAHEFMSADCAERYRTRQGLEDWVLVNVSVAMNGNRVYYSPEQPKGPVVTPAAGTF